MFGLVIMGICVSNKEHVNSIELSYLFGLRVKRKRVFVRKLDTNKELFLFRRIHHRQLDMQETGSTKQAKLPIILSIGGHG